MNHSTEFTMKWQALKLLGKSLYSNPWAAISELVANGIDAGATEVLVCLDLSKGKGDVTLEILDNGSGMDAAGISTYVQIGYNKRLNLPDDKNSKPMGRKGIGKLAALYLSDNYYLHTKTADSEPTSWKVEIPRGMQDDDSPRLELVEDNIDSYLFEKYKESESGTLIQVFNINLYGFGEKSFDALGKKLGMQFLDGPDLGVSIKLCIKKNNSDNADDFFNVDKEIAVNNLLIFRNLSDISGLPKNVAEYANRESHVKIKEREYLVSKKAAENPLERRKFTGINGEIYDIPYRLEGWIGVHASIDLDKAQENDNRFTKNRFYSPCQIRLYVRNKLAVENIIPMLGITKAGMNYVEGDISFDLLDLDELPDIATTNRQSFDENDERFEILLERVRKIVQEAVSAREDIVSEIKETKKNEASDKQNRAKSVFLREIQDDISNSIDNLDDANRLVSTIANKIQGDMSAKESHSIFISHSSKDKLLCDLLYEMLIESGVKEEEIFYTSRDETSVGTPSRESLATLIKESLINTKTKVVYFISKNFKDSEYCMFEGGAGWATKGVEEIDLIPVEYGDIPSLINGGQKQHMIEFDGDSPVLSRGNYILFASVFNSLVEHINVAREISGDIKINLINHELPRESQIDVDKGDSLVNYMDSLFVEKWKKLKVCEYRMPKDDVCDCRKESDGVKI